MRTVKELRAETGMTQQELSFYLHIPIADIQCWEAGRRNPPAYAQYLIERVLILEGQVKPNE